MGFIGNGKLIPVACSARWLPQAGASASSAASASGSLRAKQVSQQWPTSSTADTASPVYGTCSTPTTEPQNNHSRDRAVIPVGGREELRRTRLPAGVLTHIDAQAKRR